VDAGARPSPRARERARIRRAERRRRFLVWAARVAVLGVVFFAGLALGRALEEGPASEDGQTLVRTLVPETITPRATVTVTVSNP
jgi:hypothetical protein